MRAIGAEDETVDMGWFEMAAWVVKSAPATPRCAMGALFVAAAELGLGDEDLVKAEHAAADVVHETVGMHSLITYNDDPDRTAHEVAEIMRKAATDAS